MSRTLRIRNTLADEAPRSFLSVKVSSGGTVVPVKNINTFTASYAVQIGDTGEELTEILMLGTASPSGTALNTTTNTAYDHPADTPIYNINFDKVIFKRSTAGTAGTATTLSGGTTKITPDSDITRYIDSTGATGYAYRASYYNSVTTEETDASAWLTDTGFSFYSLAKIRDRIRRKLYSAKLITDDDTIDDWVNEWKERMDNTAIDVNQDYLLGTVDVSHGTAGLGTITSSDFKEIRRVWFTTNGSDYFKARKMHITDFEPNETYENTHPYYYMQGDNIFGKKPEGDLGTARLVYYKMTSRMTVDTDELPVSMRNYTKSFVDYGLAQAYYLDEKDVKGDRFMAVAESEIDRFKKQITPRSKSGPQFIKLTESTDADDGLSYYF